MDRRLEIARRVIRKRISTARAIRLRGCVTEWESSLMYALLTLRADRRARMPSRMVVTFPSPLRAFSLLIRERTKFQRLHGQRRKIGVHVRMGERCEINAVEFPFSTYFFQVFLF